MEVPSLGPSLAHGGPKLEPIMVMEVPSLSPSLAHEGRFIKKKYTARINWFGVWIQEGTNRIQECAHLFQECAHLFQECAHLIQECAHPNQNSNKSTNLNWIQNTFFNSKRRTKWVNHRTGKWWQLLLPSKPHHNQNSHKSTINNWIKNTFLT